MNKLEKENLFRKFLCLCRKPGKAEQSFFRVSIATACYNSLCSSVLCMCGTVEPMGALHRVVQKPLSSNTCLALTRTHVGTRREYT